ncbi:MAG TPA: hypothetical protein VHG53_06870 [Candidatus Limnocylindria bacterium]|nr:hypothetical protein [Candidatus Limnocylindria bacterium]
MSAERPFRLADLVANGTMSEEIGTTLRETAQARRSFLVMAVPQRAGKTTVMNAMLAEAAAVPVVALGYDGDDVGELVTRGQGGYLVVPEVSRGAWAPGYVWGDKVGQAFAGIAGGTALATGLHAPDPDEGLAIICRGCGVPDEDAARLSLVVYLRAFGPPEAPTHRRVATVHEIRGVDQGTPDARLLYRWIEKGDRFEAIDDAHRGG